MNRKKTIEAIETMQAWVAGAKIQRQPYSCIGKGGWIDYCNTYPIWDWNNYNYRTKPKLREFILEMNTDGTI